MAAGWVGRMTDVVLFHSILGVRPGILDAAERLGAADHTVHVIDQYDGRSFDDYAPMADAFAYPDLGFPELMRRALAAVPGAPYLTVSSSRRASPTARAWPSHVSRSTERSVRGCRDALGSTGRCASRIDAPCGRPVFRHILTSPSTTRTGVMTTRRLVGACRSSRRRAAPRRGVRLPGCGPPVHRCVPGRRVRRRGSPICSGAAWLPFVGLAGLTRRATASAAGSRRPVDLVVDGGRPGGASPRRCARPARPRGPAARSRAGCPAEKPRSHRRRRRRPRR